jgi:nucleotide-binding universal stress UspA family protein
MDSLMVHPELRLDFLHALQADESAAQKRWREIHAILGWESPVQPRLVSRAGNAAATILGELKSGEFGTIVLGKRGLSRIEHLLLGSVSSAVLKGLTISYLKNASDTRWRRCRPLEMLTYCRVCCAFESACALPSGVICYF